jgi:hypothetical protein
VKLWFVLLAAAALSFGCNKDEDTKDDGATSGAKSKGPDRPAPKAEWADKTVGYSRKLKLSGLSEITAGAKGLDGAVQLNLSLKKLPKGTVITVGEKKHTVEGNYDSMQAPTTFKLGDVSIKKAQDFKYQIDLGVTLKIKMPGRKELSTKVPPIPVRGALHDLFKKAADGPLQFAGEPESKGKADTAAILDRNANLKKIVGRGKVLQDIDLISFEEKEETTRTKKCTGFKGGPIKLIMVDSNVRVYDRRTAKLIKEKKFTAKTKCPSLAYVNKKDNTAKSWADTRAIERWVNRLIGR